LALDGGAVESKGFWIRNRHKFAGRAGLAAHAVYREHRNESDPWFATRSGHVSKLLFLLHFSHPNNQRDRAAGGWTVAEIPLIRRYRP